MPTKLRNLKINRVDLVDKGANQHAHVALYKRDDSPKALPAAEIVARVEKAEQALRDAVEKCGYDYMPGPAQSYEDMLLRNTVHHLYSKIGDRYSALVDTISSIVKSNDVDKAGKIKSAVKEFLAQFKASITGDVDKQVEKVLRGFDELRAFEGEPNMPMTDVEKAAFEKAQGEAIQKAVDAALAKQKTDFDAELAKRDTAIKAAEDLAKAEREKREKAEFVEIAKSLNPVVKNDEAETLRAIAAKLGDDWSKLQDILKRSATAIKEAVLKAGRTEGGDEPVDDTTAEAEVMRKAKELVAKDANGKTSIAVAIDQVLAGDRELQKRYTDEARSKARQAKTH